jgi:hypothetical protein
LWNGTDWTDYQNITTHAQPDKPALSTNLNGDVLALWIDAPNGFYMYPLYLRSAIWDGTSWTNYQDVLSIMDNREIGGVNVARDALGQYVAVYMNKSSPQQGYYLVRSKSGVWGAPIPVSPLYTQAGDQVFLLGNLAGAVTLAWPDVVTDHLEYMTSFWNAYKSKLQLPVHGLYCSPSPTLCSPMEP